MFFVNQKKQNLIPISIGVLALLGGTAIYSIYAFNSNSSPQEVAEPITTVTEKIELKAVTALGRIEPEGEAIQLSPSPDLGGTKISQLLVKEGDRVAKGEKIAILDNNARSQADVELAKQDVKVAKANLAIVKAGAKSGEIKAQEATVKRIQAELRGEITANEALIARLEAQLRTETAEKQATIERLEAELHKAESDLRRYTKLEADGVISESELESRSLNVDTATKRLVEAQAGYKRTLDTLKQQIKETKAISQQEIDTLEEQITEAEATLDRIAEVREVDVLKAQAEVDRAIAALKKAEEDLELTYVKAPTDGQIMTIHTYPGEIVGDDGVVEFGQTNQMIVVAEVYESDINRVKIGQKATVISETSAFEGEITGTVSHIGLKIGKQDVLDTDPAADVDSRVVEVEIRLDSASSDRVSALTNSKALVKIAANNDSKQ